MKLSAPTDCVGHQQPLHAGHQGPVQRPDHPPAQAEELPRPDHRGLGLLVVVRQGQGGDTPAHGAASARLVMSFYIC